MISSQQQGIVNINAVRYSNSRQHPQDSQLNQFEDNYVFKTLPSFQLSESQKKIQKSENWFKTKQDSNFRMVEEKSTCIQRKKRSNKKRQSTQQQQINPQLLLSQRKQPLSPQQQQRTNNTSVIDYSTTKQQISQLKSQLTRVEDQNYMKQAENTKLRRYIEFLQEYNHKLKKELVVVMRRRTIDDEIMEGAKWVDNGVKRQVGNGDGSCMHCVQCMCMNQTNTIKNYVKPQHSLYEPYPTSAFTTKYVTHFHQLPQKQTPYYWPSQHSKINKNKKKLPVSLQASLIGRKNLLLQSSSFNTNYTHIDTSIPTIQKVHTPQPQNYQFTQNLKVPQSYANNPSSKVNDFICSKCQETQDHSKKQLYSSKKNTKTKNRKSISTSKNSKNNKASQFFCQVHHNQSKKNKSTLPTRQRTIQNSSREKHKQCKNTKNRNSSTRKPLKCGEKVTISQFRI